MTSRAIYTQSRGYSARIGWICERCHQAQRLAKQREELQQAQIAFELLTEALDERRQPELLVSRLSFTDIVYAVSLLRAGGSEDLSAISPLETFQTPLSPTTEYDHIILKYLYGRNIICVHPRSRRESIVIQDNRFKEFFVDKVHWALPLPDTPSSPSQFLEDLEDLLASDDWPETWRAESAHLHRDLALQECLQYLRVVLNEHRLDMNPGEKTYVVLRSVLNTFSIGQAYTFIWRAAKDAAAFYLREGTSKTHAANTVPGAIQRMAERSIAEGWSVKPYRRDFRARLSIFSQVLFTTALKLPEDGFTTVPPSEEVTPQALN